MTTYEHGEVQAPALPDDWTPRRQGDTYCAPACGCKCTWAEYQAAQAGATNLIERLGEGWESQVWENAGWYYAAARGNIEVSAHTQKGRPTKFSATIRLPENTTVSESDTDPRRAVDEVLRRLRQLRATIDRALASYELDPIALGNDSAEQSEGHHG